MGNPSRYLPRPTITPDRVFFELTSKTFQDKFLLKPSKESNECILGIVGRALSLFPNLEIYAFAFLSNHFHILCSVQSLKPMSGFMNHLKSCIARKLGKLIGWFDHFWGRRYRSIPITDEQELLNRFKYILANGCREGLVKKPEDWPGVNCAKALLAGGLLEGVWHDEAGEYEARRSGQDFDPKQFDTKYAIRLKPLPMWEAFTEEERKAKTRELLDQIAQEVAAEREAKDKPEALGEKEILAQDTEAQPLKKKRSPAPCCHSSTLEGWKRYRDDYRDFVSQFRMAASCLKQKLFPVTFPVNCFIPSIGYQSEPVPIMLDGWLRAPAPG